MAPGVAGGTGFTWEPPVPAVIVPVEAVVIVVFVTEDDGGAVGLTGAKAGKVELVTTDEPVVPTDMPVADEPETVLEGAVPPFEIPVAVEPETVLAGAGAELTPGGGARFSVVTTLAPAGGSGGAGAVGGMTSPVWTSPIAGPFDATAVPGSVRCWPTRMR